MRAIIVLIFSAMLFTSTAYAGLAFESGNEFHVKGEEIYVHVMCSTQGGLISKGSVGCGYYDIDPVAQDYLVGPEQTSGFLVELKWESEEAYFKYDGKNGRTDEPIELIHMLTEPEQSIAYKISGRGVNGDIQLIDWGYIDIFTAFDVENLGWTTFPYHAPWERDCWRHQPSSMEVCQAIAPRINTQKKVIRKIPLPKK